MRILAAEEGKATAEEPASTHLLTLLGVGIGLYFLSSPWRSDHLVVQGWWTLFTAFFLFCWTSCFHETAHQMLSNSRRFGRFLGTVMFVPYTVYRECHIRHHAYLNTPNDWELWPYADPKSSRSFRRAFVWFDLLLGVIVAPYIYGRIYFHKHSPLKSPDVRSAIRREYLFMAFTWGMIWGTLAYYNAWAGYLRGWVLPTVIAGIIQTGRKLTEHLGMASYDPLFGTRTVMGKNWLTRLGSFLNFDLFVHGPHHRHPRMTHDGLAEKMLVYVQNNPETDYPIYSHYWTATWAMLPILFKNPGVGMNVGAPPPGKVKDDDVQDFVGDVTEEVLADADAVHSGQTTVAR
jgi:fatty acid desaturase